MPTPKTKAPANGVTTHAASPPAAEKKRTRSPAKKVEEREVIYPKREVMLCCVPDEDGNEYDGPITIAIAKKLLKWETEDDYVKRELLRDPNQKESKLRFGTEYMLKDRHGNKVRCWNSDRNRPFDLTHAKGLSQDILTLDWQFNMEAIIISRTGEVNSGNHRLVALVIAGEQWELNEHWRENWPEEPYLESIVCLGASDDPKVIKTLDNVKPRSLGDVFYTSPLFASKTQGERRECSRMLQGAVNLAWKRLAGKGGFIDHQTHSASLDFFERHKKLLPAVKHIHDEDASRDGGMAITNLQLGRGDCAALLFLEGQSMTDLETANAYHTAGSDVAKTEKSLDWKLWDKALAFWTELAKNPDAEKKADQPDPWVQVVKNALAGLNDPNLLTGATTPEQHTVIALAWAHFADGVKDFTVEDISPEFVYDKIKNTRSMAHIPTFGGVDLGPVRDEEKKKAIPEAPDPTPGELEKRKEEVQKTRAEKLKTDAEAARKELERGNAPLPVRADTAKKVVPIPTPRATGSLNPAAPTPAPAAKGPSTKGRNGKK